MRNSKFRLHVLYFLMYMRKKRLGDGAAHFVAPIIIIYLVDIMPCFIYGQVLMVVVVDSEQRFESVLE